MKFLGPEKLVIFKSRAQRQEIQQMVQSKKILKCRNVRRLINKIIN